MTNLLLNTLIVLITFLCMESVAWLAHKYLMHGLLWFLHEDHHQRDDQNFFEKNDFFFLIFAIPAIILMYLGIYQGFPYVLWIGAGITIYGAAYFLIHDVFIHRRFKWLRNADSPYFRAIRRAHKMHHKHLGKHHGECFGMLWVPMKYYKESLNPKRTK